MTLLTGSPVSARSAVQRSRALFSFRAADLQAQFLSGQTPTFTRAGQGGHVLDSQGRLCRTPPNAPRFSSYDTDGLSGYGRAVTLMLEGAITNSCLWSEDVSQATWSKTNLTASAALDIGTFIPGTKPFALVETVTNGVHAASQAIAITAGEYVVLMAVAKPWPRFRGSLYAEAGVDRMGADFNLNSVAFTGNQLLGAGAISGKGITYLSNGYVLIWVAGKVNAASTSVNMVLRLYDDTGTASYAGDTTKGMIWTCMQLLRCGTTGPTWQSYVGPTTGSTVTRTADGFYAAAGANAILRQTDFTIYFKLPRSPWMDLTGNLDHAPYLIRLGSANPICSISFSQSVRQITFQISDSVPNFNAVSANIPSGNVIEGVMQIDNWYNGVGMIAYDLGAGLSAFTTPLATRAIGSLGSDHILLGNAGVGSTFYLDGGIDELRILPGKLTLDQARSTL